MDIRLGDVVASKPRGMSGGVIQYGFGKTVQKGRFVRMGVLNRSPNVLLSAVANLQAKYIREGANIWRHLSKMVAQYSNPKATSTYQGAENDVLFEAKYNHPAGDATCYGPQTSKGKI
jgi:hypothetical protein